jgi:hypothetical protein
MACISNSGTFEDITEKVESELNYKLALRKFQDVFKASGVGCGSRSAVLKSHKQILVFVNFEF